MSPIIPSFLMCPQGRSVLLLFAFETMLLLLEVVRSCYRYLIFLIARRMAVAAGAGADAAAAAGPGGAEWPSRTLYLLVGKLAIDIVRLLTVIVYFAVSTCSNPRRGHRWAWRACPSRGAHHLHCTCCCDSPRRCSPCTTACPS